MNSQKTEPVYAGIDVSKDKLDLARSDTDAITTFANDAAGIASLVQQLSELNPALIVLEATGGLEQPAVDAMLDAGLPVARVNPVQVRHFAKALGLLAKTDALDGKVLVAFARHAAPRLTVKREKNRSELDALVTCRRQLLKVRTEQTNRRVTTRSTAACRSIDRVLKALNTEVASLDEQIRQIIDSDDDLRGLDQIIRSVPGVGPVLSATLLSEMTELGSVDRRRIGALVGVAPFNRDSGRFSGQRSIYGGRTDVRCTLYMATITAIRCNPVIERFAQRLKDAGKKPKVVITACMRKLIALVNAMIRERLMWSQLKIVNNP